MNAGSKAPLLLRDGRNIPGLAVSIADEGIGVPPEELQDIFNKFTRSSLTASGKSGTGLGLSICREIVHLHKGAIWAENNEKTPGAVFTFILPEDYARDCRDDSILEYHASQEASA